VKQYGAKTKFKKAIRAHIRGTVGISKSVFLYGKTFFNKPPFSRSFGTPSLLVRKDKKITR
jgi:hypothetical protein